MRPWHLLLLCMLAFGSVLPRCATAAPVSGAAAHHVAMSHGAPQPAKAHVSDACVGCATPVRPSTIMPLAPVRVGIPDSPKFPKLATRTMALDPPPPRLAA